MRALILAAGRGTRMGALAAATPKPLLEAGGRPLIAWQILRLAAAGIRELVVNVAEHAALFRERLGDGSSLGVAIAWSEEGPEPLETGGGMLRALPLLGPGPFLAVNADVFCDLDYRALPPAPRGLAHLVLVPNPPHHPEGDFALTADGRLSVAGTARHTFAGIGLYRPELLEGWEEATGPVPRSPLGDPVFPLAPLLRRAASQGLLHGELHRGLWLDVGTPERLAALRARLAGTP